MSDISRRVKKAEKTLGVDNQPKKPEVICVRLRNINEPEPDLPENVEDWITYKEQLKEGKDLIILFSHKEGEARERVRKAMKNNQKQLKAENSDKQDE